jgi:hypothetical protein
VGVAKIAYAVQRSCAMAKGLPTRLTSGSALLAIFLLFMMTAIVAGCGGGSGAAAGGPTPTPTPSPTPIPGTSAGLLMKVADATVPTGGIFQYQLELTEPKPIGTSSTRPTLPGGGTGPVRGVAVNDASGKAVGVAVINGSNVAISIQSPDASLGMDTDYPLLVLTMPVTSTAVGSKFQVGLDPSSTFFNGGNAYTIQENVPGTLTIGGTLSITDVVPGGGVVNDGDTISVLGIGFDANTKIQVNNDPSAVQTFVSSNRIDVKIVSPCVPESDPCRASSTLQLDGDRIRAINTNTNETVEYFSYARTDDESGASANTTVTQVHPMFSRQTYAAGSIPYVSDATHFTGISVQNTSVTDATFKVEVLDASNNVIGSQSGIAVRARKKITRDIRDWVTTINGTPATIRVTVTSGPQALQMLGFVGDTAAGTVVPVAFQ